MNIDTIVLKFEAVFTKMKSDLSDTIKKWENLDNATSNVSNTFNKMANNVNSSMNKMAKSIDSSGAKENLQKLQEQLKIMKDTYKSNLDYFNSKRSAFSSSVLDTRGMSEIQLKEAQKNANIPLLTKQQLDDSKRDIDVLEAKIKELSSTIENTSSKKLIKKENIDSNAIEKASENTKKVSKNFDGVSNKIKKTASNFSKLRNTVDNTKKSLNGMTSSLKKTADSSFRRLKKLTLGLVGVRTAMSLLTKGVNAYLSFDSELQDSISNSWNMLGALLAPAIEVVANGFALATNYIAQFISALTGIDLVARANAKALETQAKANEKANKAQRGLLSMDEITNLPTESGGSVANEIKTIDTKPIKWLNELLNALKKYKWHEAGEIIAESITNGLRKIKWDEIRDKAEKTGKNIATFLNGVFELDWRGIGSSFANGLNTLVDLFHGFFKDLEWGRLGAGIANSVNGFFNDFDFKKLGETITDGISGVLDTAISFIDNLDAEALANSVIDFIESIDWLKIGKKIIKLLIDGIRFGIKTNGKLWDRIVDDIKEQFSPKIDKFGEKIGGDLGKRIADAIKNGLYGGLNGVKYSIFPGTQIIDIFSGNIPKLATGTNEIEYEGLYHLHEGEAVVPKKYNPIISNYDNSSDNKQIIDLLVSLNANIIQYAERPNNISINGKKVAEAIYDDTQQISRNKNISNVVTRS